MDPENYIQIKMFMLLMKEGCYKFGNEDGLLSGILEQFDEYKHETLKVQ